VEACGSESGNGARATAGCRSGRLDKAKVCYLAKSFIFVQLNSNTLCFLS